MYKEAKMSVMSALFHVLAKTLLAAALCMSWSLLTDFLVQMI